MQTKLSLTPSQKKVLYSELSYVGLPTGYFTNTIFDLKRKNK